MMNGELKSYNIAFIPTEAGISDKLCQVSSAIQARQKNLYFLRPEQSIPHVTLCQFQACDADLETICHWLEQTPSPEVDLSIEGCQILPKETNEKSVVFALIEASQKLLEWHDSCLKMLSDLDHVCLEGRVGAAYLPHITVGCAAHPLKFTEEDISAFFDFPVLFRGRLAVGTVGEYGQMPEILYRF